MRDRRPRVSAILSGRTILKLSASADAAPGTGQVRRGKFHYRSEFIFEARKTQQTFGAANRTRTCDPVITNDVLYQLSYCGGPSGAFRNGLKTLAPDIGQDALLQEKRTPPRG
jgi:hypothetical protein